MGKGQSRAGARGRPALGVLASLVGVLALAISCRGSTSTGTDSNTHWLSSCSGDADCGDLSCICGVCSTPCTIDGHCDGLGESAVCEELSTCATAAGPHQLCTAACSIQADCQKFSADLTCVGNHCEHAGRTASGQGGAGASATMTGGEAADTGGTASRGGGASTANAGTPSADGGATSAGGTPGSGGTGATVGTGATAGTAGGALSPAGGAPSTGGDSAGSAGLGTTEPGGRPSTGATGGSAGTAGSGHAGGSPNRLVLDPTSLEFSSLPIDSIRYMVSGYDPDLRICASLVWYYSVPYGVGLARCSGDPAEEPFEMPYVLIETDTDGPCDAWDYGPNVETLSWNGCVDFAHWRPTAMNLADLELEVQGDAFTGTIVASNREAGTVSFGIEYEPSDPEDFYVQTSNDLSVPSWIDVTTVGGETVNMFDRCDVPLCGGDDTVCGLAMGETTNITRSTAGGAIYVTWDGRIRTENQAEQCMVEGRATPGDYEAHFCWGHASVDDGAGQHVESPVCRTMQFTYPTDVVITRVTE